MSNKVANILIAAAAGLAAGVALGMLFAPEKGSETRKKLRKTLDDIADGLGDTIEQKLASIREILEGEPPSEKRDPGDATAGK
jgi:gas vesicle protein